MKGRQSLEQKMLQRTCRGRLSFVNIELLIGIASISIVSLAILGFAFS